jgi:hypothetical protein
LKVNRVLRDLREGAPKASEAARVAAGARVSWVPHDRPFEDLGTTPSRVISAVDVNRARGALQNLYPPRILSASTFDMRAGVLRCGPPGKGACLRCYNPPEALDPDEEIRARLREASDADLAALGVEADVSAEEARAWSREGRCGQAGERLLGYIRQNDEGPRRFAVGFTSVMAGTMLAAETMKEVLGAEDVPLSDRRPRAALQFWRPAAETNRSGPYGRDPECPMCEPGRPATKIWGRRFEEFRPQRASG